MGNSAILELVIVGVILTWIILLAIRKLYRRVPESKCLVVSGLGKTRFITKGGAIVIPFLQRVEELNIGARDVFISGEHITKDRIPVRVLASAVYR